jgi:hypothetical protein
MIKKEFSLLKDLPNILNLSKSVIDSYKVEGGPRKIFVILKLIENRIDHFTKPVIFSLISDIKKREKIEIVNIPKYLLPITYNTTTDGMIVNLLSMGSDDLSRYDPKNIYAALVYAVCFARLVSGKYKVEEKYFIPISNFLISIFIRLFGKDYGLLGIYSTEIPKLKFLTNCYILKSFFDVDTEKMYKLSSVAASFNYKSLDMNDLDNIDFYQIKNFINSLSHFKVMPGINPYIFSSKILKLFGYGFLPALEDLSRFISIMTTSSLSGSNIVPTFISKYNESEYVKILEISKGIFKK